MYINFIYTECPVDQNLPFIIMYSPYYIGIWLIQLGFDNFQQWNLSSFK